MRQDVGRVPTLDEIRAHLTPESEDELLYLTPGTPSQLAQLTEPELFRLFRKVAMANTWPTNTQVEYEMMARLIMALEEHSHASDRAARRLETLTKVLVTLTIVIAIFTIALFFRS
jgi:hypothetical protein